MKNIKCVYTYFLMSLCVASSASYAAEGGFYSGPIGGSDMRAALVGSPGSLQVGAGFVPQWSNLYTGNHGQPNPNAQSVAFSAQGININISYVWPWQLMNGKFSSKIQDQYSFACFRKLSRQQCNSGFTDPYVDFLSYSFKVGMLGAKPPKEPVKSKIPYGLYIAPAFSMSIPEGRYNVNDLINQGHNSAIFVPNMSFTYTTGPNLAFGDATEFSTRVYYEIAADNPKTGYRNGNVFVDDFALTERWTHFQFGMSGTVATGTTNDTKHGHVVLVNGNRLFDFLIGPVINYDVPKWHANFGLKGLYDVTSHNRLMHNMVMIKAGFSVF